MRKPSHVDRLLLKNGEIYLWGDVEDDTVFDVVTKLRYLHRMLQQDQEIKLFIFSEGGCIDGTTAIIDEIQLLRSYERVVSTICIGKAFSCGAFILAQGTTGYRYATPNSTIMLHPPSVELPEDFVSQQELVATFCKNQAESIMRMTAIACKKSRKMSQFAKDIDKGLWLTATEAKKYGVIDQIRE